MWKMFERRIVIFFKPINVGAQGALKRTVSLRDNFQIRTLILDLITVDCVVVLKDDVGSAFNKLWSYIQYTTEFKLSENFYIISLP